MRHISILGAGWMGLPLANALHAQGDRVSVSTRSMRPSRLAQEIEHCKVNLTDSNLTDNASFFTTDALVILVPPKIRTQGSNQYESQMKRLVDFLLSMNFAQPLLFASSTAVYGNNEKPQDEFSIPSPVSTSGSALLKVENLFASTFKHTCILRFAGLFGPNRNPANFFKNGRTLQAPHVPVNLIHLEDCIGIIKAVLAQKFEGILNAVAPNHPTKLEFYGALAKKNGYNLECDTQSDKIGKVIESGIIGSAIPYIFKHTNLLKSALF